MPLFTEIIKNISGYSRAKYSTWFYYKADNILFDAGEGVSLALKNRVYGIDHIFLSHGHGDHITGLPGFLGTRASSMGDRYKPLSIYFPRGNSSILKLKNYLESAYHFLTFPLKWVELDPGDKIQLEGNRFLEAFATIHCPRELSLGYKVVEQRKKLKSEYSSLPKQKIVEVVREKGRDHITEAYDHPLLCYSGDTMPLDIKHFKNAEVLLYDATFLLAKDREESTHAALEEVFPMAIQAGVSALGLFHFSIRYHYSEILQAIQQQINVWQPNFPVYFILPHSSCFSFKNVVED